MSDLPGGALIERELIRGGAYSQNQVTRIYLVAFQFIYSISLWKQHTILRLTYITSMQFLSQTIIKSTCKVVQLNKWKIFGKF